MGEQANASPEVAVVASPPPEASSTPKDVQPEPRAVEPVAQAPVIQQPVPEPAFAGGSYEEAGSPLVSRQRPLANDIPPPPLFKHEPEVRGYQEDRSRFEHEPPFRRNRNPARMWMVAALLFAVISIGGIGAVAWYGLPDWVPFARPTFAGAPEDLVLDFPPNRQDRRQLPNGTEFFGASGTVTNIGGERREVPPILIVLRDGGERVVYSWEVAPPKRQLAPGETITINEAVTDVPRTAKIAEIGWKPG